MALKDGRIENFDEFWCLVAFKRFGILWSINQLKIGFFIIHEVHKNIIKKPITLKEECLYLVSVATCTKRMWSQLSHSSCQHWSSLRTNFDIICYIQNNTLYEIKSSNKRSGLIFGTTWHLKLKLFKCR